MGIVARKKESMVNESELLFDASLVQKINPKCSKFIHGWFGLCGQSPILVVYRIVLS